MKTYEEYLESVKQNFFNMKDVPEQFRTSEMWLAVCKNNQTRPYREVIAFKIKKELFTQEICDVCIKTRRSIIYIPDEFKTFELCLEACREYFDYLDYIPEKFHIDIIKQSLKNKNKFSENTYELYLNAVNYSLALKYVPEEFKTKELCFLSLKSGLDVTLFPKQLQTKEIYLECVKQEGGCLSFIPKEFITYEICLEAVKNDGYVIQYVPEKFNTEEICLIAVKHNGYYLRDISNQTEEMCLIAVKQNGNYVQWVKNQTDEICIQALKQNIKSFEFIKNPSRTVIDYYNLVNL